MQIPPVSSFVDPRATVPEARIEQLFLEEMLKYAMPQSDGHSFGGGIGEQQFQSFLTRHYAEYLAQSIDLGFDIPGKAND